MCAEVKVAWKGYKYLKKHASEVISLKRKKMKLLTNEQQESHEKAKLCQI